MSEAPVSPHPTASPADVERNIEQLVKKRDHAADVLNKPLLAWTYQQEIDTLLAQQPKP